MLESLDVGKAESALCVESSLKADVTSQDT